jgi:ribosome-binding factor A
METKRMSQLNEMLKRNFSVVLQQEGRYIYGGEILVSVTKVIISPDLSQAKVYVSIFGTEAKDNVIIAMEQHIQTLKNELAKRIRKQIRRIPELYVYNDETLDEMYKIDELLKNLK